MSSENLLIVFIKNPDLRKVKTRLAKSIGQAQALKVYDMLLSHTLNISQHLPCDKAVFYSERTEPGDQWAQSGFMQYIQEGDDLGEKMYNAFRYAFHRDYRSAVIIGSDCLELSGSVINSAFRSLMSSDVVIGPATDGGYYLLGMNKLHDEIFVNKSWSSPYLLEETLISISRLNLSLKLMETLSDIDDINDLQKYQHFFPDIYPYNITHNPN